MTHLLDVKSVFRVRIPEIHFLLSQGHLNLSNLFIVMCDSNRVLTRGGRRYFVTFIDDYSKFYYTYFLKSKDEVLDWFDKTEAENQFERKSRI